MRKLGLIVKREYLTRVKTKGFIVGTILVPVIGILFCLLIQTCSSSHEALGSRLTRRCEQNLPRNVSSA